MRHSAWRQRRIGLLCGCAAQRGEGTSAADGGAQRSTFSFCLKNTIKIDHEYSMQTCHCGSATKP